MRSRAAIIPALLVLVLSGCDNDDTTPMPVIEGLSLYWDHEVFGDEGRRLRFEFNTTNEFVNDHELVFDYTIDGNVISARLVSTVDKGKCHFFPTPSPTNDDPYKCNASGGFFVPDDVLTNGTYSLKIITPFFEVTSELAVADDHVTLSIPPNDHLISSISHVYPIPKDIVFGGVVYRGADNTQDMEQFFEDLAGLGLTDITVPNYPYRHLYVDSNGRPVDSHWEPDNHVMRFLYGMNKDFNTILEMATEHFHQTNLNIYLYTSNGDQGLMDQVTGITVVYGKQ